MASFIEHRVNSEPCQLSKFKVTYPCYLRTFFVFISTNNFQQLIFLVGANNLLVELNNLLVVATHFLTKQIKFVEANNKLVTSNLLFVVNYLIVEANDF